MEREDALAMFCSITGAPTHVADHYLSAHDWDLNRSIEFFLENPVDGSRERVEPRVEEPDDPPEQHRQQSFTATHRTQGDFGAHPLSNDFDDEQADIQRALAASLDETALNAPTVTRSDRVELVDDDDMDVEDDVAMAAPMAQMHAQRRQQARHLEDELPHQANRTLRSRSRSNQPPPDEVEGVEGELNRLWQSATHSMGPMEGMPNGIRGSRMPIFPPPFAAVPHGPRFPREPPAQPSPPPSFHHLHDDDEGFPQFPEGVDVEEARMLEAAMLGIPYGDDPEHVSRLIAREQQREQQRQDRMARGSASDEDPAARHARMLREEQDLEYEMSLVADREKAEAVQRALDEAEQAERRAAEEAQALERQAAEAAAAAMAAEQRAQEALARKAAALPQEPAAEDPAAVAVAVRLPDGSRHTRRFLRTAPFRGLFDFVDVQGAASGLKPGSYNLVTQFPRRVFTSDTAGSLEEAGLSHKQEALLVDLQNGS